MAVVDGFSDMKLSENKMCGMIAAWGAIISGANRIPKWQGPRANMANRATPRAGTFARAG